jgi:hypothetical protein
MLCFSSGGPSGACDPYFAACSTKIIFGYWTVAKQLFPARKCPESDLLASSAPPTESSTGSSHINAHLKGAISHAMPSR